jgi:hypothetical protein
MRDLKCAVLEMRGGPSNSECRLGVQTTRCCVGVMARVVNERGKGGRHPVRCVLRRRTRVNR